MIFRGSEVNKQLQTLEEFINLQHQMVAGHVIRAASHSGIFTALAEGQKTIEELAEAANLDPKGVELTTNLLVDLKVLERYDDQIALSPAAKMLTPNLLGGLHWQQLPEYLKTGQLETTDGMTFEDQLAQLDWMKTPAAMDAVVAMDFGKTRRGVRVLELGCGSGVFSATFAHRDPDSTFVLADTALNIDRARKTMESIGVAGQCDFFEAEDLAPPSDMGGFDLVMITGQLHLHSAKWCKEYLKEVRRVMHFDGELAIIDLFPGQEGGEINLAFYELELSLRVKDGQLHSAADLTKMLKAADFQNIQFAHLPSPPKYWGLVVAAF